MKKVYFTHPVEKLHAIFRTMIDYPPDGYTFLTPGSSLRLSGNTNKKNDIPKWKKMGEGLLRLTQPYSWFALDSVKWILSDPLRKVPPDIDIIFSPFSGYIFKRTPWVVAVDNVFEFSHYDYKYSKIYQLIFKKSLSSQYCKKIMPWCNRVKDLLFLQYDCKKFEDKIETLHPAVPKKTFKRLYNTSKIRLLFMSTTGYYGFHEKGGKEVLEAFSVLNNRYSNIELVVRSPLDPDVERKYSKILKLSNVKVYDKVLPRKNIELLYSSSDILLSPGCDVTSIVTLEGMSYEMPVVAVDGGGMTEAVQDGKTGFLIRPSEKVPDSPKEYHYFRENISKRVRSDIVKGIIEKTGILIENKSLREKMGKEGRKEIEKGIFSIEKRNRKLKKIFEEAMKK